MNDDRSLERAARSWLEAGPTEAPDRAVEAALLQIETTSQERDLRIPWRLPRMTTPARVALLYLGRPGQSVVGVPATPSPQPISTPAPSAEVATPAPSPARSPVAAVVPSSDLVRFASTVYPYTISIPSNWKSRPAILPITPDEFPYPDNLAVDYFSASAPDQVSPALIVAAPVVTGGTTLETWVATIEKRQRDTGVARGWAQCTSPDTSSAIRFGSGAGRLLTWNACPAFVLWAATVHQDRAVHILWVDDQATDDPALQASEKALFERILATFDFTKTAPAGPSPS